MPTGKASFRVHMIVKYGPEQVTEIVNACNTQIPLTIDDQSWNYGDTVVFVGRTTNSDLPSLLFAIGSVCATETGKGVGVIQIPRSISISEFLDRWPKWQWARNPTGTTSVDGKLARHILRRIFSELPLEDADFKTLPEANNARLMVEDLPAPRNAWLIFGDDASRKTRRDIQDMCLIGNNDEPPQWWTCSPHTEWGDLLFFYFTAPTKAIMLVGRATCRAFYRRDINVNADRGVTSHQWWTHVCPMAITEPLSLETIREAHGHDVILKGRSGKYLPNTVANRLLAKTNIAYSPAQWCTNAVTVGVIGRDEIPDPSTMSLQDWCDLPSGVLRTESEVEEVIVLPLLRFALPPASDLSIERQYRVGRRLADFAITRSGAPVGIIETKRRLRIPENSHWSESPDVQQAAYYARRFGVPYVLIDCDQIACFEPTSQEPTLRVNRRCATWEDCQAIGKYLC